MADRSFIGAGFIFLSGVSVVASCAERKQVSLPELKRYAIDPENGLIQSDLSNDFAFEVIYRPKDLVIEQNTGLKEEALWNSEAARMATYDYFIFRISKNKKEVEARFAGDPSSYTKVINYLNGGISNDVFMVIGNETVNVADALFTPAYGTATASSVLIIFNSNLLTRNADFKIVFEDTQFATGRHEFSFEFASIQAIPDLKRGI